jgi:dihydroxyacetone kinase-like protein
MKDRITRDELARMIAGAAARIREQHAMLSKLDCVAGDGDHGTTMLRTVEQLEKAAADAEAADLKTVFRDAGWRVLGVDGGASSSLVGTFFLGMADTPAESEALNCRELAATFEAGLAAVRKQTKAQPGDKTMMDALVPAVAALRRAAEAGKDVTAALREAAAAAHSGAEATKDLIARFGRAKLLGEKTRGHADPGATSIALLFAGFASALAESKGEVRDA